MLYSALISTGSLRFRIICKMPFRPSRKTYASGLRLPVDELEGTGTGQNIVQTIRGPGIEP